MNNDAKVRRPTTIHRLVKGLIAGRQLITRAIRTLSLHIANVLIEHRVRNELSEQYSVEADYECILYFADDPINAYQVRQWYEPMRQLSLDHPVAILSGKPLSAKALAEDSPIPILLATDMRQREAILTSSSVKIVLYVNNSKENFLALRFSGPIHIHLNHGESDKASMVSNQLKAYDYIFVAGAASAERITRHLRGLGPNRIREIGRPQLDSTPKGTTVPEDGRIVVLYAPTWEGDRPAMAYGSVVSHGKAMVPLLLSDCRFRLIYRPHPRVGARDKAQAKASKEIALAIRSANEIDPSACHIMDETKEFGWQMKAADIAIADVSAVATDWLSTGRPIIITKPHDPHAYVDPHGMVGVLPTMSISEVNHVNSRISQLVSEGVSREQVTQLRRHYGDSSLGTGTDRFRATVDKLLIENEMV